MDKIVRHAAFRREPGDLSWVPAVPVEGWQIKGGKSWQSNGGRHRRHPARALPYSLEVEIPRNEGRLSRIGLVGIFALYADPASEPAGALGGSLQLLRAGECVQRLDLIQGRHYDDPRSSEQIFRPIGDGSRLETIGRTSVEGEMHRVDLLSLVVANNAAPQTLVLMDLGTPASFVLFDVIFEFEQTAVCPFRGHGDDVALNEIGGILRLRDRSRYTRAVAQLQEGVMRAVEIDEARSLGLTFIASICAALLEIGAPKSTHRVILEVARSIDRLESPEAIAEHVEAVAHTLTTNVFPESRTPTEALMDQALSYVEMHFAKDLTDDVVAAHVGLSTSHFRHLFRHATRQPFHKYLLSLRLEKAREMLLRSEISVGEIAELVGFASPAHFSRTFSSRFGAAPSALRSGRR